MRSSYLCTAGILAITAIAAVNSAPIPLPDARPPKIPSQLSGTQEQGKVWMTPVKLSFKPGQIDEGRWHHILKRLQRLGVEVLWKPPFEMSKAGAEEKWLYGYFHETARIDLDYIAGPNLWVSTMPGVAEPEEAIGKCPPGICREGYGCNSPATIAECAARNDWAK